MLKRCNDPTDVSYANYGGRGIVVCQQWRESFDNFYKDMGGRTKGMTLDRIDCNGDYTPDNCRWATHRVQNRNKRQTVYLTAFGQTRPVAEWADIVGVPRDTILHRLQRYGWDAERALRKPKVNIRYELNGESLTATECAKRLGIATMTLLHRIKRGWMIGDAPPVPGRRIIPRSSE